MTNTKNLFNNMSFSCHYICISLIKNYLYLHYNNLYFYENSKQD